MSPLDFAAVESVKPALGRLKDRVALVTGVARPRGVGAAIARLFAREGAAVCVTDMVPEVRARAAEIEAAGGRALAIEADLTKWPAVEKMTAGIIASLGRIDILVNVAGKSVPPRPAFSDMSLEYFDMVMDRNLRTAVHCCKAVLPEMLGRNYGKIVNIGSTTGVVGVYRHCAAYAASKGALTAFGKALALEVGVHNINVNTIMPSDIDTGDAPWKPGDPARDLGLYAAHLAPAIPRPVRSEEVAELALFLAGDESRAVTGASYLIDAGVTLVEGMVSGPQ
ncbi:MAG: SDR family oxidoreductase [Candidatus Adiutrix sp.]|jgi:NAD(P)-dependent dehydrogenase (short-subunit alcohol dehydrogenase family)|nr:SDR family oxidoreductase [Candidatus Adiutrix sp.]